MARGSGQATLHNMSVTIIYGTTIAQSKTHSHFFLHGASELEKKNKNEFLLPKLTVSSWRFRKKKEMVFGFFLLFFFFE